MDDKIIVDIYDLDNLKTDCEYKTIRINIIDDKIYSLEIDREIHNINKIEISETKLLTILDFTEIIKKYCYYGCLIGIKFILQNIETHVKFNSEIFHDYIYDGQIIIDKINDIFELEIYKKSPITNGYIQINIYKLKLFSDEYKIMNSLYNCRHDNEYVNPDKYFYNLKSTTLFIKLSYDHMNTIIKEYKHNNKLIKTIEIPFLSNNIEGTLQCELYKPCKYYCYFLIIKIIYNGSIIDTIQNTKCNCIEYELQDYIKTHNKFFNRQKMCLCFVRKLFFKLNNMNIKYYKIDKNILIDELYINKTFDEILRYFYIY